MNTKYEQYQKDTSIPAETWAWNIYGAGLENFGRDEKPEKFPVPEPADDQILVRIDSVGMCFSDVKIIKQGRKHPKLYNRDLANDPSRLGHEVALTVVKAGKDLQDKYYSGQRFAVQPDIYQNGKSTAYGYTIPGGLIQYHLMGDEIFDTDEGVCLLPVGEKMGYAAASFLEPWGCVFASYTQRRRLEPKEGGTMWIVGNPGESRTFTFSKFLDRPVRFVLTDVPLSIRSALEKTRAEVITRDGIATGDIASFSNELTGEGGFDDIVMLSPLDAERVGEVAKTIARRGTMVLACDKPLEGLVQTDVGRLHYDYIAFMGTQKEEITSAYGEQRNRCELRAGGVTVVVGAGGPMGQMHVQRALEMPDGPSKVIATELSQERIQVLQQSFEPLSRKTGRGFHLFNPKESGQSLHDYLMEMSDGKGADDVVVCVPIAPVMEEAATLMNNNGMLVLFAGVPKLTYAAVDLSKVYMHNAQFTGTSGLRITDQAQVREQAEKGALSPERVVAAVGGMQAARQGMQAVMNGSYPGKVVIFPQIMDLPLMSLDELSQIYPQIGSKLGEGNTWTKEAEAALFDQLWTGK